MHGRCSTDIETACRHELNLKTYIGYIGYVCPTWTPRCKCPCFIGLFELNMTSNKIVNVFAVACDPQDTLGTFRFVTELRAETSQQLVMLFPMLIC